MGLLFELIELYIKFMIICIYWGIRMFIWVMRALLIGTVLLIGAIATLIQEEKRRRAARQSAG